MAKRQSFYASARPMMRRNLRKLIRRATDADMREGLAWYPTASAGCIAWSQQTGIDARTIACVIAAISPQCDWTSNLRIAFEVLAGQPLVTGGALRANVTKARRVLADRATTLDGYFKGGPKVKAFAANLQGLSNHVTVDTHAVQAALNKPLWRKTFHDNAYAIVADVYRDVAREFDMRPCDFQAVIWCAWKRRHTTSDKKRKRMLARERANGRTA